MRDAAWIARCVGRKETAPLRESDIAAIASYLETREIDRGGVVFPAGASPEGVWIIRTGLVELIVGSGRRRVVVQLLVPGDVDGDMQLILEMPLPYTARAVEHARVLFLPAPAFEELLRERPAIARRWLSSVAARVSRSQMRILELLGKSLPERTARLILQEAIGERVPLPQRTLAAMLGVQRPSLNKTLKDLEAKELVTLGYAEVTIVDRQGLEKIAS